MICLNFLINHFIYFFFGKFQCLLLKIFFLIRKYWEINQMWHFSLSTVKLSLLIWFHGKQDVFWKFFWNLLSTNESRMCEEPEQIYMEPYAHLQKDFQNSTKVSKAGEELHFMCTVLDSDLNGNISSPSPKSEPKDHRRSSLEAIDTEDYEKVSSAQRVVLFSRHQNLLHT